jgi:hypothetical protein
MSPTHRDGTPEKDLAAQRGAFAIVKYLIGAGADPSIHGGAEQGTAERFARDNDHRDISEFLRYNERKPSA